MRGYTVGADVGGTHVRLALLDPEGRMSHPVKFARAAVMPDGDPGAFGETLRDYIRDCGVPVSAAAAGIPGTLSRDCREVLNVPNIPALNGRMLADELTERAGVPVKLENDTVMLLSGDMHRLSLPQTGLLLGVYIGTGLGSAVFYDGMPLKGKNSLNELGHFPIPGRKERCSCGNVGCAENLVSGRRLQELRERKWPDTHISELFPAMRGSEELEEFIDIAACILAGSVNLLDPEVLVIGGGVPAMRGFPRAELETALREKAMHPRPSENLTVIWSDGADETGALGAAWMARM